jgi:hypothetical protein
LFDEGSHCFENNGRCLKGVVLGVFIHHILAYLFAGIAYGVQSKSNDSDDRLPEKEHDLPACP